MSYLRPRIQAKLDGMVARQHELMARAANPDEPPERLSQIQRELGSMTRVVTEYEAYREVLRQIEDNKALLGPDGDPELAELAKEELPELEADAKKRAEQMIDYLLREAGDSQRDCIIEIRAGTGGEEAALFARDLTELYQRYATRMRWKIDPMHTAEADQGGYKEVVFAMRGEDVFHFMQFESGGHRVQRVPDTEAKGRVHTSAATVAVLPEVADVEVHVEEKDLRVDTYRSSGAGGQHVNKTDSAVRITHIPTGVVVACQDERSQHKNRARAMKMLRARLYEAQQRAQQEARAAHRKDQVGSGDRSERVRTYNFPQDRLTDHRLQRNFSLTQIMEGRLDPVVEALLADDRERRLEEL
ncbi:MAG: peptide chain release factor 1 [Planctomycetota bacterium]|nr:peptide chain release factor 1 [Planctomycetota bacterium]